MTLGGFFTADDFAGFLADRNHALRSLRCGANQHVMLIDVREMIIQSQESVLRFHRIMSDPRATGKRVAFVVSQSLARLQAQRAAQNRNAEYFATPEEAEAWLFKVEATAA